MSGLIGAAPETARRRLPPNRPRILESTFLSAKAYSRCSRKPGLRPAAFGLPHLLAGLDRPVEDRFFEAALFFHAAVGGGVDLLEDARHRGEVGRFQFAEVGDDLVRIALPVGDRGAEIEAAELDQQGEGVGERQVEVGDVVLRDHAGLVDHVEHRAVVAVADDAALRRPGRARGVDEGADVGRGDRVDPLLEDRVVDLGAFPCELVRREDVVGSALHHHDLLEPRQAGADLTDLGQLLLVLDDDHLGVGVLEDVGALLGRVGLVDRHHGGADRERRVVEVGPLGMRVAQDRDAIAFLDPERDEA